VLPSCEFMCRGVIVINSSTTDSSPIDDILMFTLLLPNLRFVLIYHIHMYVHGSPLRQKYILYNNSSIIVSIS